MRLTGSYEVSVLDSLVPDPDLDLDLVLVGIVLVVVVVRTGDRYQKDYLQYKKKMQDRNSKVSKNDVRMYGCMM